MSSMSWFLAGLFAGAAITLGALLLVRASRETGRGNGRMLLAGLLGAAAAAVVVGGMSLAIDARHPPVPAPAAAPSAADVPSSPALTSAAPMPSAAAMEQLLRMPSGSGGQSAEPMDQAAARLAARLQSKGGTAADWNLLAQAYDFLGRPKEAQAARARAAQIGASQAPAR
jgi:hypothetical protein